MVVAVVVAGRGRGRGRKGYCGSAIVHTKAVGQRACHLFSLTNVIACRVFCWVLIVCEDLAHFASRRISVLHARLVHWPVLTVGLQS